MSVDERQFGLKIVWFPWVAWAYVFFSALFSLFVVQTFGSDYGLTVFVILLLPAVLALRLRWSHQNLNRRDVGLVVAMVFGTISALGLCVWRWYDLHLDQYQSATLEAKKFDRLLRSDPAFQNVSVIATPKHIFWLKGEVSSVADLDRLKVMVDQSQYIDWNEDVKVTESQ